MSNPGSYHSDYRGWPNVRAVDARAFPHFYPSHAPADSEYYRGWRPNSDVSRKDFELRQTNPLRRDHDDNDRSDEKPSKPSFVEYLFSTTGFQGPGKIWEAPYKPLKVLWLLAFLAASTIMVIQLEELFEEYFSFPVKTQVKLKFNPLPLPALTLCNMNPIRKTFAENFSCNIQDLLNLPDHLRRADCVGEDHFNLDFLSPDYYYCYDCDYEVDYADFYQEDLDSFTYRRESIAYYMAREDRETRKTAGHQYEDLVVSCNFFGRQCPSKYVTSFLSREYGNCYTISAPAIKATRSGPESALVLTLNLETEEFVDTYKTGYGVRVVLHEHGTRPFPSSEGITLSAGSEINIAVRMTEVIRKGGRYGSCQDDADVLTAISGYKYTITNCREQCLSKLIMDHCKCALLGDEQLVNLSSPAVAKVKLCTTEKDYKCALKEHERYMNITASGRYDKCKCENPCHELVYTPTLSTRAWPVLSHIPVLEEQVCKLNGNSPKCGYYLEDFTTDSLDLRQGFARVKLYYERLNYENVHETPFYNTERFLSDIGGTLGLWIGVTVLGLVEFFEIGLLAVSTCYKKLRSRSKRH